MPPVTGLGFPQPSRSLLPLRCFGEEIFQIQYLCAAFVPTWALTALSAYRRLITINYFLLLFFYVYISSCKSNYVFNEKLENEAR